MRTLIAIIAVFALIVGGFFYVGIYRPRQQQQAKLARAAAVVDRHRAQVIAREADLQAIAKTLDTLELHPASPPLPEPTTFALVTTGVLRKRAGLPPVPGEPSLHEQVYLDQAMSLVETGKRFPFEKERNDDAEMAERMLGPIARMRYALLVDTTVYREPVMHGDKEFIPGMWSAKIYLFDVPSRAYLAGWTLSAESSWSVGQGGIFVGEIALGDDLRKRIMDALVPSIRANVHGGR